MTVTAIDCLSGDKLISIVVSRSSTAIAGEGAGDFAFQSWDRGQLVVRAPFIAARSRKEKYRCPLEVKIKFAHLFFVDGG